MFLEIIKEQMQIIPHQLFEEAGRVVLACEPMQWNRTLSDSHRTCLPIRSAFAGDLHHCQPANQWHPDNGIIALKDLHW